MRDRIIELIVKYATSQKTVINEFSGDISGDLYNLHCELMDFTETFDTENISYFVDIFPKLPDDFHRMYQERYGD
jgi:hypothetical protein